jgi:hypothetical protein
MARLFVSTKDVQILTGKGKTAAHRLIMAIKKSFDKQKYLPLTVQEFCEYTGLPLDIVVEQLK